MASSMLSFSSRSCIAGSSVSARRAVAPAAVPRAATVAVHASRVCDLTGTKRNKANRVCFSNKKSRKWQEPNLQEKKVYWEFGQRWVKLKICTRAIKTLEKVRSLTDAMFAADRHAGGMLPCMSQKCQPPLTFLLVFRVTFVPPAPC